MPLFAKIAIFAVYGVITGLISGEIANAVHNVNDATYAWLAFLAVGLVVLTMIPRRSAALRV